ncbi:Alpha-methylacyl-CoA racemase [Trichostrongylus colubriformis]|uniref:Alpha-methylacyl-CoA racemase n=1 Tax=Trichostrongylus colubriformis TaxID=6319 RepID=A0AAN8FZA8_TRICO
MNRTLLHGIRVIELAGLAPVPHCGMVLADFGANVTVIEKPSRDGDLPVEQRMAERKTLKSLDLKSPQDIEKLRQLCRTSDVLLDPYRPGVLEQLDLDPVKLLEENKGLIVCRLTGYGQTGPLAQEAGHDINYVSITGLLPTTSGHSCPRPWPPVNLLADFAGGGLTAAFGIVTALLNREKNGGQGCIIDCSMAEGLSYLASFVRRYHDIEHLWTQPYAAFSGDCPIYRTYKTKDDKWLAVGALEPKFSRNLFHVLGIDKDISDVFADPATVAIEMEEAFRTKTREEWMELFAGKQACVTPVLDLDEAVQYGHNVARGNFTNEGNGSIPQPAPRMYTKEEFKKLKSKL